MKSCVVPLLKGSFVWEKRNAQGRQFQLPSSSPPPLHPPRRLHLSPPRLSAFIPHGRSTLEGKQIDCRQLKTLISRRAGFAPETPIPKINNLKKKKRKRRKKEEGSTSFRQCLTMRGRDWCGQGRWANTAGVGLTNTQEGRDGAGDHDQDPRAERRSLAAATRSEWSR